MLNNYLRLFHLDDVVKMSLERKRMRINFPMVWTQGELLLNFYWVIIHKHTSNIVLTGYIRHRLAKCTLYTCQRSINYWIQFELALCKKIKPCVRLLHICFSMDFQTYTSVAKSVTLLLNFVSDFDNVNSTIKYCQRVLISFVNLHEFRRISLILLVTHQNQFT